MIYRMDITKPADNRYRVLLTADDGNHIETVRAAKSPKMPRKAQLREWLRGLGFEAYGDIKIMNDGSLRSMVRRLA